MGIKIPIIREGDDLKSIIINSFNDIQDGDIIGITESVVARAQGNYVTIDDIVQFLEEHHYSKNLILKNPIMSRNRFSMILKAFARYAEEITIIISEKYDEQGNPNFEVNPFTGINILKYYKEICDKENCSFNIFTGHEYTDCFIQKDSTCIDCKCHPNNKFGVNLSQVMNTPVTRKDGSVSGYNPDWGLLGSNKANKETLKLFPIKEKAQQLVEDIQNEIFDKVKKKVEVMVYGDGCFKSPEYQGVSIWEFADPVTSPAYTSGLEGSPNEIKIKAFADDKYSHLKGKELEEAIKKEIKNNKDTSLIGNMASQGTTPRRYVDLLASLMDLTSGSGDKGTPVILVRNYFKKYFD